MKGRDGTAFARALMVDSVREFDRMVRHLGGQPWVALDTESDSLFRYTPRVCLIQVSAPASRGESSQDANTENVRDFLVDPLKLKDLSALGGILADDGTEVILHAAENDILTLQRDFGFRIRCLYDTQLAARIMGRVGVGLAQVLLEEFDVVSDKRMQRTNWGQRPLTAQQMAYAQVDTHFLPALRARQTRQLKASGRWEEAQDAFRILETIEYSPPEPRTFWQMKQIRSVDEKNLNVLETIWDWRERHSQRTERPPFKVLGESTLVALALDRPQSIDALRKITGLSGRQVDRFGRELLEAVRQGGRRPVPRRPAAAKRSDSTLSAEGRRRFDALRRWRTETAAARGVDPDIVFSNETLVQISAGRPDSVAALAAIPAIGRWKAQTYGPAVLKMLKGRGKA
jgi:ribonuclease D